MNFSKKEKSSMTSVNKIFFYKINEKYGFCSNFYKHPIEIDGKIWPTTEHYFQACKFTNKAHKEKIRNASTPTQAKKLGNSREYKIRSDWEEVKVDFMMIAVLNKFSNRELKHKLLNVPDDTLLCEHCYDTFWGDGMDGSGVNMLGRILIAVRYILKYGTIKPACDDLRKLIDFKQLELEDENEIVDEYGRTPIIIAAQKDDMKEIQRLIEEKANINHADNYRDTALYWACVNINNEMLTLLVENGADVNSVFRESETPLLLSCFCNNENGVKLLLKNKADIKHEDENGNTALIKAAKNKNILKILIDNKADINDKNNDDESALYLAIINVFHPQGDFEAAKYLLEKGARLSDDERENLLEIAKQRKNMIIEEFVLKLKNNFE